jgi:EAL domain-containing protein (putative c-di-GMP-specific phosphodiesterase class I)
VLGSGRALGTRVVAEGVDREAQWTRFGEPGCEYGQGYCRSRPVDAAALAA